MTDQFLELELRVLILRYGRRGVVEALARLGEQSVEDIEHELARVQERKPRRRSEPKAIADLVAKACAGRPEIGELVEKIANRFENRTFLPQLRDVTRFLDGAGVAHGRLKSRREAAGVVIRTLAGLPRDELEHLANPPSGRGESDYAVLAREIMGDRRGSGGHERDAGAGD